MNEAYIGEIRFFAGPFVPRDWLFCDGQTLEIAQYTALFRVISNTFGGNNSTNFKLPDLRGRAPVGAGKGPFTSNYNLGATTGTEMVTLSVAQIPAHTHVGQMYASSRPPTQKLPTSNLLARGSRTSTMPSIYAPDFSPLEVMDPRALRLDITGGSDAHNNMQPFLACNFIICFNGYFPSHD